MSTRSPKSGSKATIGCATCNKRFIPDMSSPFMPFCSERCKLIDLGRWMNEEIGLPHVRSEEDEEDSEPEAPEQVREWRFE